MAAYNISKEANQVKWRGIKLAHGEDFLPTGPAKYQATPAQLTDGDLTPLLVDQYGRPIVVQYEKDRNITHWGGTALTGRDISLDLKALTDDTIKGLLRSIGDAGDSPANITGKTLLKLLADLYTRIRILDGDITLQRRFSFYRYNDLTDVVLHTVPEGRTFYVTNISVAGRVNNASCAIIVLLRDTNDTEAGYLFSHSVRNSGGYGNSGHITFINPVVVPSGYDIVLHLEGGIGGELLITGVMVGWEE